MASYQSGITACVVLFVASGLFCYGQKFHMRHAPPYVVYQSQSPDTPVSSSDLHNVLGGPLGLNNKQASIIQSKSVLKRPKANVLFTIVTHKNQELPVNSLASFPVDWDTPYVDIEQLMNKLQSKFLEKNPLMLDILSRDKVFDIKTSSSLFQSLPSSFDAALRRYLDPATSFFNRLESPPKKMSLNSSRSSDGILLAELQMVDDAVSALKNKPEHLDTKSPDLLSFTLTGLQGVGEEYGVNSEQAKDAKDIITKLLNQIVEELKTLYKDNVMIGYLIVPHVDVSKVRKTRSLMESESGDIGDMRRRLNLEIDWYADFPAIFNIVLWLMIILLITIFFVAYGIWNLNPNLESILYRVPQDDLKKLN